MCTDLPLINTSQKKWRSEVYERSPEIRNMIIKGVFWFTL